MMTWKTSLSNPDSWRLETQLNNAQNISDGFQSRERLQGHFSSASGKFTMKPGEQVCFEKLPSEYPGSLPGMDEFLVGKSTSPCQSQLQSWTIKNLQRKSPSRFSIVPLFLVLYIKDVLMKFRLTSYADDSEAKCGERKQRFSGLLVKYYNLKSLKHDSQQERVNTSCVLKFERTVMVLRADYTCVSHTYRHYHWLMN